MTQTEMGSSASTWDLGQWSEAYRETQLRRCDGTLGLMTPERLKQAYVQDEITVEELERGLEICHDREAKRSRARSRG